MGGEERGIAKAACFLRRDTIFGVFRFRVDATTGSDSPLLSGPVSEGTRFRANRSSVSGFARMSGGVLDLSAL